MRALSTVAALTLVAIPAGADVCGRSDVLGPYGFQLSGTTTIGAYGPQAQAAIGRVVFDSDGHVSGISSVNLNGYFLGNPVIGRYTFQTDCTLTFELQDSSGGIQHFQGTAKLGGNSAAIHQTDEGAGGRGVLERSYGGCSVASLTGTYALALSGTASQFASEETPGSPFSLNATVVADGAGGVGVTTSSGKTSGSFQVDSDCVVEIQMGVQMGESAAIFKLRGVLVRDGKLLLAVESDPTHTATARLTARR